MHLLDIADIDHIHVVNKRARCDPARQRTARESATTNRRYDVLVGSTPFRAAGERCRSRPASSSWARLADSVNSAKPARVPVKNSRLVALLLKLRFT